MERETVKLTTPSGKQVEIKTYLTAKERNALRAIFLQNVAVNPASGQQTGDVLASDLVEKGNQKALELAVVSFDGSTENILDRLENAEHKQSIEDYDFVLEHATKIGNFSPAK